MAMTDGTERETLSNGKEPDGTERELTERRETKWNGLNAAGPDGTEEAKWNVG